MSQKLWHALVLLCLLFFNGCGASKPELSFYYWKTTLNADSAADTLWRALDPHRAYIRLFDVDRSSGADAPHPVAHLAATTDALSLTEWVGVVFITNRTFIGMDRAAAHQLADHLVAEVAHVVKRTGWRAPVGLQLDCDWTGQTKNAYFHFLERVNTLVKRDPAWSPNLVLSATIRLHQVRDRALTGIPPVARGALMVYQTSAVDDLDGPRSILDMSLVSGYLRNAADYPLPLDVALPLFSWALHYNADGRLIRILRDGRIQAGQTLEPVPDRPSVYRATDDFLIGEHRVMRGDFLKIERVTFDELQTLSELLATRLGRAPRELIFFQFDVQLINEVCHDQPQALHQLRDLF